jgi:hypothetical protein
MTLKSKPELSENHCIWSRSEVGDASQKSREELELPITALLPIVSSRIRLLARPQRPGDIISYDFFSDTLVVLF